MLAPQSQIKLGDWFFYPAEQILVDPSEQQIALESKTTTVLLCLVRAEGKLVRRDDLMLWTWRDVLVSEDSLYRCIYQLRRIFAEGPGRTPRIVTVRGSGYRLVIEDTETRGTQRASTADRGAKRPGSKPKHTARFAPVAFLLTMMIIGMISVLGSIELLESRKESEVIGLPVPSSVHQPLLSVSFFDSLETKKFDGIDYSIETDPARIDSMLSSLKTLRPGMSWTTKESATIEHP